MIGDDHKEGPACMHWGRIGTICPRCGVDVVARKATDERFILEAIALSSTLILNVLDVMLTLVGIKRGILFEANPLLAPLVDMPVVFIFAKLGVVVAGLVVLWKLKHHKWVLPASFLLFWVYVAMVAYHLQGILDLCTAVS